MPESKNVIIIGASSGIGKALAEKFSSLGFTVGITGRRTELLEECARSLPSKAFTAAMDITKPEQAAETLRELIERMGGADIIVISAGTGFINPELEWEKELTAVQTNVTGFTALADAAMHFFLAKGAGHLVGISSIAGIRGSRFSPSYSASKAYVSNYLEGLSCLAHHTAPNICVTDVQPGFVDTAMAQGDGIFWLCPPEKAAEQICRALVKRKRKLYVSKRWILISWILKLLPRFLYQRM